MKFWIYVICFLPAIILDILVQEYVSFPSIAYSFFPGGAFYEVAGLSGLMAGVVKVLLYVPPFYFSKKWIAPREVKMGSQAKPMFPGIARVIGVVLGSLVLAGSLILLLQTESAWFASFMNTFCDYLVVVGFVITTISTFIRLKKEEVGTILRIAGSSLLVLGLALFYLFAKLHNM